MNVLKPTSLRKVRLAGIDAPEMGQPFGAQSRQHLEAVLASKEVVVVWHKTDRYGRLVGKVLLSDHDAAMAQIEAGLAWHFVKYSREQSADDRRSYTAAEARARESRVGLWMQVSGTTGPEAPWDYRSRLRSH